MPDSMILQMKFQVTDSGQIHVFRNAQHPQPPCLQMRQLDNSFDESVLGATHSTDVISDVNLTLGISTDISSPVSVTSIPRNIMCDDTPHIVDFSTPAVSPIFINNVTTPVISVLSTTPHPSELTTFVRNSLTPCILDFPTPTPSEVDVNTSSSMTSDSTLLLTHSSESENEESTDLNANDILKGIRVKNINRVMIGTLNQEDDISLIEHKFPLIQI